MPSTIVLQLRGKRHEIGYHAGDTVLETARRANLPAPYSCEAGSCATCMALVLDGSVTMRVNNALTPDEVEEGWILTCQSLPVGPSLQCRLRGRLIAGSGQAPDFDNEVLLTG